MKIYTLLIKANGYDAYIYRKAFTKKEDVFPEIENYALIRGYSEVRIMENIDDQCTKIIYGSRAYPDLKIVFIIKEVEVIE